MGRQANQDELDRISVLEDEVRQLKLHAWGDGSGGGGGGGTDTDIFGAHPFGAAAPKEASGLSLSFVNGFQTVNFTTEVTDPDNVYNPAFSGYGIYAPPDAGFYYVHASFELLLWTAGYIDVGFEIVHPADPPPSGLWPTVDAKRRWRQSFNATGLNDGMAVGHAGVFALDGTNGIRVQMDNSSAGATGGHIDQGYFQGWRVA